MPTATIHTHKTLSTPVYEATIRRGPVVLWTKLFKRGTPEFVAFAVTQRMARTFTARPI